MKQQGDNMFEATAVWRTDTKEFVPAGFTIMVEVEPVSTNVMPTSMDMIMGNISDGRCDGFVIDLGTSKKHIIKS
jgi:hypothetical protein